MRKLSNVLEKYWAILVAAKIQEGAKLISEAANMAKDHGVSISDLYEINDPLLSVVDECGWNASMSCY